MSSNPYDLDEISKWQASGKFDRAGMNLAGDELLVLVKN
jgi:hypothetical protein